MEWVKTLPPARFNLAISGMLFCPMSELGVDPSTLEINGPSAYGHPPLVEAVARHCSVDPACVVIAEGTSMVNHLAMATLVDPGDEVLVESPGYELLPATLRYLGAEVRSFPRPRETGFQIDPAALRRALTPRTRLIVLTNLHNPSSALTPESTLREIGAIAAEAGIRVLVDEVYLETLPGPLPRSAFHLGPQFVTTNSLTKAYGLNGLRCGWALAEPDLARRMWRLNDLFGVIPSHLSEKVSLAAFHAMPRLRARTEAHLAAHWKLLDTALAGCGVIEWLRPPSGTVAFPRLTRGSVDAFCSQLLDQHGTRVTPGEFFGAKDHFRLGIAGTTDMVAPGLKALRALLDAW